MTSAARSWNGLSIGLNQICNDMCKVSKSNNTSRMNLLNFHHSEKKARSMPSSDDQGTDDICGGAGMQSFWFIAHSSSPVYTVTHAFHQSAVVVDMIRMRRNAVSDLTHDANL